MVHQTNGGSSGRRNEVPRLPDTEKLKNLFDDLGEYDSDRPSSHRGSVGWGIAKGMCRPEDVSGVVTGWPNIGRLKYKCTSHSR